jgi:hypothetical protein
MPDYSDHELIADTKRRYLRDPDDPQWREVFAAQYVSFDPHTRMAVRDRISSELGESVSSGPSRKLAQLHVFLRHIDHLERQLRKVGR